MDMYCYALLDCVLLLRILSDLRRIYNIGYLLAQSIESTRLKFLIDQVKYVGPLFYNAVSKLLSVYSFTVYLTLQTR